MSLVAVISVIKALYNNRVNNARFWVSGLTCFARMAKIGVIALPLQFIN